MFLYSLFVLIKNKHVMYVIYIGINVVANRGRGGGGGDLFPAKDGTSGAAM